MTERGITESLATFVEGADFESLSPEVVTAAKRAVLDTVGVTIAGALEEGSRIVYDYVSDGDSAGEASVFGTALKTTAGQAALVNGAFGHALDFDDVTGSMRGHPSVPVLPAVLALAERLGRGGREAITAFAVGFEVECRLGRASGVSQYARGWHATSVMGTPGAAAACAKLLRLDVEQTRHALAIAGSMASGSRQNFGTMTKPLHAGLAARNGVDAALLASRGFTADTEMLEAPLGFGVLFSPDGDWDPERMGEPGEPWEIVTPGISVKQYPCCYMTHTALDATLAATGAAAGDAASVEAVEVRVPEGSTSALIHHRPTTGLEGKFSMEYCVATAVLDGHVRLATFDDDYVRREQAQDLLRRVEVVHVPRDGDEFFAGARITVSRSDGSTSTGEATAPRGSASDPLSWDELVAKYRDCTSRVLPEEQVERSLDLIERFDEVRVDELARAVTPAGAGAAS